MLNSIQTNLNACKKADKHSIIQRIAIVHANQAAYVIINDAPPVKIVFQSYPSSKLIEIPINYSKKISANSLCDKLKAQSLKYEAVCEIQPKIYSIHPIIVPTHISAITGFYSSGCNLQCIIVQIGEAIIIQITLIIVIANMNNYT